VSCRIFRLNPDEAPVLKIIGTAIFDGIEINKPKKDIS
jgi:hypothetical protein